jgi:hypothetical protein
MKELEMPKAELVYFENGDIITASIICEGQQW